MITVLWHFFPIISDHSNLQSTITLLSATCLMAVDPFIYLPECLPIFLTTAYHPQINSDSIPSKKPFFSSLIQNIFSVLDAHNTYLCGTDISVKCLFFAFNLAFKCFSY